MAQDLLGSSRPKDHDVRRGGSADVADALRTHLWQRAPGVLSDWVATAPLHLLTEAESLRALTPPASAAARAATRLGLLASLLRGRGMIALRMLAIEVAEQCGMERGRTRLLQFETMAEAGDAQAALGFASDCLAMPTLPHGWRRTLQDGVATLLAGGEPAPAARAVLKATGLHFVDDVVTILGPDAGGLTLAGLLDDAGLRRAGVVQGVLALALRGMLPGARVLARHLPADSDEATAAALALELGAGGNVAGAAAALTALASADGALAQAMPLTLTLLLALADEATAVEPARVAGRRPLPEPKVAELMAVAAPRPGGATAFAGVLAEAGCAPLSLLEVQGAVGVPVSPVVARLALARLAIGTAMPAADVLRTLQAGLQADDTGSDLAGLLSEAAERHETALMALPQGPAVLARVRTDVQDWPGALAAWDRVIAQARQAEGPLVRAFAVAARMGRADLAHDYLDQVLALPSLRDGDAALTLVHGACVLGDLVLARRLWPMLSALPSDDPRRARGGLVWRLQVLLSGQIDGGPEAAAPALPPEPPHEGAPMPRALVIDPGFAANSGHHLPYTLFAVRFLAIELGVAEPEVWACVRRDPPGLESAGLDPLRPSLHRALDLNPYAFKEFPRSEETMTNLARAVEADLDQALDGADLRQVRVVYWHSMKAASVAGFAAWVARRFAGRAVTVIVGVIEVDYLNAPPEARGPSRQAYAMGLQRLRATPGVSLIVHAETVVACDELVAVSSTGPSGPGMPVHLLPYLPADTLARDTPVRPAFAQRTVTIGIVGGSRPDRGLELFPELILALADVPDLRWEVQVTRGHLERIDPVLATYMDWAVRRGLCRWHQGPLPAQDYEQALRRMDVVLLPYSNRYAVSGSGVFFEALALGRLVVVPDKTAMHDLLRSWNLPGLSLRAPTVAVAEKVLRGLLRERAVWRAALADPSRLSAARPGVADLRRLLHAALNASAG